MWKDLLVSPFPMTLGGSRSPCPEPEETTAVMEESAEIINVTSDEKRDYKSGILEKMPQKLGKYLII